MLAQPLRISWRRNWRMSVDTGKSRPDDEHHPPAHHTHLRETVATLFQTTARAFRQPSVWSTRQSRQGAAGARPVPGHRHQVDAVGCSPPVPAVATKQCPQPCRTVLPAPSCNRQSEGGLLRRQRKVRRKFDGPKRGGCRAVTATGSLLSAKLPSLSVRCG